ncbi:MAG: hypothetical protein ABR955_01965 [Verrucomicrobiota bacterium]|jgi:hypothetical protein
MNTSEIIQLIKSAGFYPIQVEWNSNRNENSDLRFAGSLEDFFPAAKALGATIVFFFVWKLEEDFLYDSDYEEDGDENSDEEETDSDKSAGNK